MPERIVPESFRVLLRAFAGVVRRAAAWRTDAAMCGRSWRLRVSR